MDRREKIRELKFHAPVILPSLLLCDFGDLRQEVARLEQAGVRALHLDVMDGQFVPNLTYGFPIVEAFRRLTQLPLDVHLMVERPERYIDRFLDAGADGITIHVEATERPGDVLAMIRQAGAAAGIAINPDTPIEQLDGTLDKCDLVLVMSVQAGFGGQAFRPEALERMRWVRQHVDSSVLLEIDGGINSQTVGAATAAGAELLVVGSAIFGQDDYAQAVRLLQLGAHHAS